MTQLSPKPGSHHTNGRGSFSNNSHIEGLTSASNYSASPPRRVQSQPEPKAIRHPQPQQIPAIPLPQGYARQQWQWRKWFSGSLRVKVTALALIIGTIPVVGVGTFAYFSSSGQLFEEAVQKERVNAHDLSDKLTKFIDERFGDLGILSNILSFTDAKLRKEIPRQLKEEFLDRFVQTYNFYDSIAVFDTNGNLLAQSQSEALPNHSDRDYFQEVLRTDRPVMTEPRVSETKKSRELEIYFAAPIKDRETGKTIAVVRTRFPLATLQKAFSIQKSRGQEFFALDTSNTIYASTIEESLGKKFEQIFPKMASSVQKLGRADQNIIGTNELTRIESVETFSPVKELEQKLGKKWSLILVTPTSTVFATRQFLLNTVLLGTGVTILLVAAFAAYIASRATRPLLEAASAVDKIGQGQLDTRVEILGEDELAVLGANINEMAAQLGNFLQEQEVAAEQALLLARVTGSRAVSSKELEDFLGDILEQTRKLLNADRVIFYRFNSDLGGYISGEAVASGLRSTLNSKVEEAFVPELLFESRLQNNVLAINNIFEADVPLDHLRLLERLEIKAILEVPVFHEGQPYGLLIAHQCEVAHEWQDSQINFFKQLSAQMGLSLDRVILLERTEELLQQTGQLASEQQHLKEGLQQRALDLLKEVDPISKGDLTIRARVTADEIGTIADSYNATVGNLRKIVGQVQQAATEVAETTISNEASVQSLSVEALRQAEDIAQALNRAQEMAESVRQVAANAQLAETAVQQAAQTVQEGDQAMNRTVDGILTIRDTVAETAKKVKHLGESSQKISTVVNLISTFAAQTNLLALNASIEAARAGEEGRGFAVVADEVRALARQSAEATSEIEKLVAGIQAETNEVVAAMESGTEQVVTGTKLVEETRQSLNKITAASTQINELVESITQATVVQSKASEEVTRTMTNVATSADKTSKEASLVSSSFEQLLKVAQGLQENVGRFKVS